MEWMHPERFWWLLALLPLAVLLYFQIKRKRDTVPSIWRDEHHAYHLFRRRGIIIVCWMVALAFLIIALAGPRKGDRPIDKVSDEPAIVLALDISRSMLTQDILPNRLATAKNIGLQLVKTLPQSQMGSLVFAGNAYVNMPLTTDVSALPSFINNVTVEMAGTQGTSIGEAIELALASFQSEETGPVQLVILSDGEDHEENAIEMAERASKEGMTIHAVGIGTSEGGRIPIRNNSGNQYLRDQNNEIVISRLKDPLLKEISRMTGGIYVRYTSLPEVVNKMKKAIESSKSGNKKTLTYRSYKYFHQYPIMAALFLLLIALAVQWKKI